MSRPFSSRSSSPAGSFVRINGKIRAREVRVIGPDGQQVGVMALHEAINAARARGMDLVEVAPNAAPPVCRIVDYGKFRYEQSKKEKESKKRQHANRVKEIQLTATIDEHDFEVKLGHATDFLCEEMRVKLSLRFRGREMAHQEFGRQVMDRFIKELGPYGLPVETPKLVGRGLNVMLTPLPRNKRAKNPRVVEDGQAPGQIRKDLSPLRQIPATEGPDELPEDEGSDEQGQPADEARTGFANNPFAQLDGQLRDRPAA